MCVKMHVKMRVKMRKKCVHQMEHVLLGKTRKCAYCKSYNRENDCKVGKVVKRQTKTIE